MEKEILLNQFIDEFLKRRIPSYSDQLNVLTLSKNKELQWITNSEFNEGFFNNNGRIGIGRSPLFSYKLDIGVNKNTVETALHIGDGSLGFSFGNGTSDGFLPEIIGVGSSNTDAGLYFLGIAGNNIASDVPLLVFDGRSVDKKELTNRPIFGVKSGNNDFNLIIDASGNINIKKDIILDNKSLLNIINELTNEIENLKIKINKLI